MSQEMQVLSVNVGEPREIEYRGKRIRTGIFKTPVNQSARLSRLTFSGDTQCDLRVHGGVDQAAYCYDQADYDFWRKTEGRDDLHYGKFGENLTVDGMQGDQVCIGDEFQIGQAMVQVSHPRVPCFKLGIAMDDPSFVRRFHEAGRVGFYVRVLQEGEVMAGDAIEKCKAGVGTLSVQDAFRIMHLDKSDVEGAKRAAAVPALSLEWRERLLERQ